MELVVLLIACAAVLYFTGAWDWLVMAAAFVLQRASGDRSLAVLRLKLAALKAIARAVGRLERRLARLDAERSPPRR